MLRLTILILFFCGYLFSDGLAGQVVISEPAQGDPQESYPFLRADGSMLYFTRPDYEYNSGTENAADIWTMIRHTDGTWGRALNPGSPINSFAHDRVVGLSPDGTQIAILRTGSASYIDLLETSGRNWRIVTGWVVPPDAALRFDLTFDVNARQIIYSAYDGGNLDLFRRQALANGEWSAPSQLTQASGPGNETAPSIAADGRTLYFQRDGGRWFRQSTPSTRPVAVAIPPNVRNFSTSLLANEIIASLSPSPSQKERLQVIAVSSADLPAPAALFRGYLTTALAPGEATIDVTLTEGQKLTVTPDASNSYAVFLRKGERIDSGLSTITTPGTRGGLASTRSFASADIDRQRLQTSIENRQQELDRLEVARRQYEVTAPTEDDAELTAQQNRYQRSSVSSDTLPPVRTTGQVPATARNDRYATELAELERMKAKFRQQQNDKLNERSGLTKYGWSEKSATTTTTSPTVRSRQTTYLTSAERAKAYEDSLRIAAEIRNGLQHDATPRAYERQPWENEVRQDLPRSQPLSREETAKLDADYQRQLAELEALRSKLRVMESEPTNATSEPNPNAWTSRSPTAPQAALPPATYGNTTQRTATYSERSSTLERSSSREGNTNRLLGAPMPAGISFIPNTAYPDTRGYDGLDQLVVLLRQSGMLEVRVHTPLALNRRAAQRLSEERAKTIYNFLLDQAIPPDQFTVIGYGNNLTGDQGERVEVVRK